MRFAWPLRIAGSQYRWKRL